MGGGWVAKIGGAGVLTAFLLFAGVKIFSHPWLAFGDPRFSQALDEVIALHRQGRVECWNVQNGTCDSTTAVVWSTERLGIALDQMQIDGTVILTKTPVFRSDDLICFHPEEMVVTWDGANSSGSADIAAGMLTQVLAQKGATICNGYIKTGYNAYKTLTYAGWYVGPLSETNLGDTEEIAAFLPEALPLRDSNEDSAEGARAQAYAGTPSNSPSTLPNYNEYLIPSAQWLVGAWDIEGQNDVSCAGDVGEFFEANGHWRNYDYSGTWALSGAKLRTVRKYEEEYVEAPRPLAKPVIEYVEIVSASTGSFVGALPDGTRRTYIRCPGKSHD